MDSGNFGRLVDSADRLCISRHCSRCRWILMRKSGRWWLDISNSSCFRIDFSSDGVPSVHFPVKCDPKLNISQYQHQCQCVVDFKSALQTRAHFGRMCRRLVVLNFFFGITRRRVEWSYTKHFGFPSDCPTFGATFGLFWLMCFILRLS
jgi:hypothetical protein